MWHNEQGRIAQRRSGSGLHGPGNLADVCRHPLHGGQHPRGQGPSFVFHFSFDLTLTWVSVYRATWPGLCPFTSRRWPCSRASSRPGNSWSNCSANSFYWSSTASKLCETPNSHPPTLLCTSPLIHLFSFIQLWSAAGWKPHTGLRLYGIAIG